MFSQIQRTQVSGAGSGLRFIQESGLEVHVFCIEASKPGSINDLRNKVQVWLVMLDSS